MRIKQIIQQVLTIELGKDALKFILTGTVEVIPFVWLIDVYNSHVVQIINGGEQNRRIQ